MDSRKLKITVELSDSELRDVIRFTGEKQKGPAIRKPVVDALMLRRRGLTSEKFKNGEWKVDFPAFENYARSTGRMHGKSDRHSVAVVAAADLARWP
ncbi:hypothetical protein BH20VER3_BH20VER3_15340 [soil metagenome]